MSILGLKKKGFTLIELLIVMAIIAIIISVSLFGLSGARESARDAKRKSDLELIRGGIETYRADCTLYPQALANSLVGNDLLPTCLSKNTYISQVPADPLSPAQKYLYYSDGTIYEVCAHLEQTAAGVSVTCGGSNDCGKTCNYKVINP